MSAFQSKLYAEVLAGNGRYMTNKKARVTVFWMWSGKYFGQWRLGDKTVYQEWAFVVLPFVEPDQYRNSAKALAAQELKASLLEKLADPVWDQYSAGARRYWEVLGRPEIDKWLIEEFEKAAEYCKFGLKLTIRLAKLILKTRSYIKAMKVLMYGYTEAVIKQNRPAFPAFLPRWSDANYLLQVRGMPLIDTRSVSRQEYCGNTLPLKVWRTFFHKKASVEVQDSYNQLIDLKDMALRDQDKEWVAQTLAKFEENYSFGVLKDAHNRCTLLRQLYSSQANINERAIIARKKWKAECEWTIPEGMMLLSTVEEFLEEGTRVAHYVASYYNNTNSHILSIRTVEGDSTVELCNGSVVQWRGYGNSKVTFESHHTIMRLFLKNQF